MTAQRFASEASGLISLLFYGYPLEGAPPVVSQFVKKHLQYTCS